VNKPDFDGDRWNLELECMPHAKEAMQRVDAWYHCEIVDRAPIRFMAHNAFLDTGVDYAALSPEERRARWFDVEFQVALFERSIEGRLTADPLHTFGGFGVVQIPRFQALLRHICANGYEHPVAVNRARVADALDEILTKHLGWNISHHKEGS
jgi:hypothetical protein